MPQSSAAIGPGLGGVACRPVAAPHIQLPAGLQTGLAGGRQWHGQLAHASQRVGSGRDIGTQRRTGGHTGAAGLLQAARSRTERGVDGLRAVDQLQQERITQAFPPLVQRGQ